MDKCPKFSALGAQPPDPQVAWEEGQIGLLREGCGQGGLGLSHPRSTLPSQNTPPKGLTLSHSNFKLLGAPPRDPQTSPVYLGWYSWQKKIPRGCHGGAGGRMAPTLHRPLPRPPGNNFDKGGHLQQPCTLGPAASQSWGLPPKLHPWLCLHPGLMDNLTT